MVIVLAQPFVRLATVAVISATLIVVLVVFTAIHVFLLAAVGPPATLATTTTQFISLHVFVDVSWLKVEALLFW